MKTSQVPFYNITLSMNVVREASQERIRTPQDIVKILSDIAGLAQEVFVVLTTNTKHRLIGKHMVSMGSVDSCIVHPREVFRPAIMDVASAIVVAHNHPSGDPTPSAEDIRITRKLVDAGKLLEIAVLDHVILGRGEIPFISLRESGMVSFQ